MIPPHYDADLVCADVIDEVAIGVTGTGSYHYRQSILVPVDEMPHRQLLVSPPESIWFERRHTGTSSLPKE